MPSRPWPTKELLEAFLEHVVNTSSLQRLAQAAAALRPRALGPTSRKCMEADRTPQPRPSDTCKCKARALHGRLQGQSCDE